MKGVTGRCSDFSGPAEPAIATSQGWIPLTDENIDELARSAMLLAFSPEHVERLRREDRSTDRGLDSSAA
jgi:hypothetical protein